MTKTIYGVDPKQKFNTENVRDAIINCFKEAHSDILDSYSEYAGNTDKDELEDLKKINVEYLIKKFFEETGGNFENPKKEDLIKVCDKLAEFSKNFRSRKIITKHYSEIMGLIKKL